MVERDHPDLSIGHQCALLQVPRSSFCDTLQAETDQNLAFAMDLGPVAATWLTAADRRAVIDTPFFGVRQMTWHLRSCRDRGPSGAA